MSLRQLKSAKMFGLDLDFIRKVSTTLMEVKKLEDELWKEMMKVFQPLLLVLLSLLILMLSLLVALYLMLRASWKTKKDEDEDWVDIKRRVIFVHPDLGVGGNQ